MESSYFRKVCAFEYWKLEEDQGHDLSYREYAVIIGFALLLNSNRFNKHSPRHCMTCDCSYHTYQLICPTEKSKR